MTAPAVTRTPAGVMDEARALLAMVKDPAPSVRYARDCLAAVVDLHDRIEAGTADPFDALAPDMGWWEDPQQSALEYLAYEVSELATALEKRITEAARREAGPIPAGGPR